MTRYRTDTRKHSPRLTRRGLLQHAGGLIAVAAFPPSALATQRGTAGPAASTDRHSLSDVMVRLSTYMSEAATRPLPDGVLERTKWHVLDTIAAMVSGSELPPGRAATSFAHAYGGKPVATVVADTNLCGPFEAALANGVLAHADETDDSWGGWHPGCSIVPATLATGEQFGISGEHFLRAVALGYDIGARFVTTVRPGLQGSHRALHGIGGYFGSGAAAGCAARLTTQQMRWMLDYSAQQCSGIQSWYRDPDHIKKGFVFGGMPARGGVTSALLVHGGWNGVEDVLSGPDNFLLATSPDADPDLLIEQLGERYEITNTNLKRWTVGASIQAPLDAMEALVKSHPVDPDQVQQILLRSAPGAPTDNGDPPDINVQYALALMLIDKTVTFRSTHDKARMQDPAILRLREKVRLEAPRGEAGGNRQPLLEVTLSDGTRLTQDTGPVLGTLANPMTIEQVISKSQDLMAPVIGTTQTAQLVDTTLGLEAVRDIRDLRPLLQRVYHEGTPRLSDYPASR